jgi:hypothetical protein
MKRQDKHDFSAEFGETWVMDCVSEAEGNIKIKEMTGYLNANPNKFPKGCYYLLGHSKENKDGYIGIWFIDPTVKERR